MSTLAKILAIIVAFNAVAVSAASAGQYKKIEDTVQDGHNGLRIFFQAGGYFFKDQHMRGDPNAATLCAKQCTKTVWCKSFDIQHVRGECNLSSTRIGDEDGGIAKYDPNADYYEWVDAVEHHR